MSLSSWYRRATSSQASPAGSYWTQHLDLFVADPVPTCISKHQRQKPYCTYALVIAHLLTFIVHIGVARFQFSPWKLNILIGAPDNIQRWFGASQNLVYAGAYWRLLTCIWLHAGIIPLLLTCAALYRTGIDVELEHGKLPLLGIYFLASLGGAMTSVIFSYPNRIAICGSAGLFGLFGSDIAFFVHNYYQLGRNRWRYLIISLTCSSIGLTLGLHPLLDNFAHIGGFITGIAVSFAVLSQFQRVRGHPWLKYNLRTLSICSVFALLSLAILLAMAVMIATQCSPNCPICHYLDCIPLSSWTCPQP